MSKLCQGVLGLLHVTNEITWIIVSMINYFSQHFRGFSSTDYDQYSNRCIRIYVHENVPVAQYSFSDEINLTTNVDYNMRYKTTGYSVCWQMRHMKTRMSNHVWLDTYSHEREKKGSVEKAKLLSVKHVIRNIERRASQMMCTFDVNEYYWRVSNAKNIEHRTNIIKNTCTFRMRWFTQHRITSLLSQ
jgi:hypothetical protein